MMSGAHLRQSGVPQDEGKIATRRTMYKRPGKVSLVSWVPVTSLIHLVRGGTRQMAKQKLEQMSKCQSHTDVTPCVTSR